MNTAYNATAGHLAGIQRRVVRVMAVALLVFTSCKKSPSPPPTFREAQSLAGGIVLCLLVEHEPDEYASEVRRQAQESIPALAVAYSGCTSEQKESVRRFVRGFVDYEDSQYADLCRWYVQIERAIASKDLESRNQALQAEILTERTKAIVQDRIWMPLGKRYDNSMRKILTRKLPATQRTHVELHLAFWELKSI